MTGYSGGRRYEWRGQTPDPDAVARTAAAKTRMRSAGQSPRRARKISTCFLCGLERVIFARGLCRCCYQLARESGTLDDWKPNAAPPVLVRVVSEDGVLAGIGEWMHEGQRYAAFCNNVEASEMIGALAHRLSEQVKAFTAPKITV